MDVDQCKTRVCDKLKRCHKKQWLRVFGVESTIRSTMNGKVSFGMYVIESNSLKGGMILHGVAI